MSSRSEFSHHALASIELSGGSAADESAAAIGSVEAASSKSGTLQDELQALRVQNEALEHKHHAVKASMHG